MKTIGYVVVLAVVIALVGILSQSLFGGRSEVLPLPQDLPSAEEPQQSSAAPETAPAPEQAAAPEAAGSAESAPEADPEAPLTDEEYQATVSMLLDRLEMRDLTKLSLLLGGKMTPEEAVSVINSYADRFTAEEQAQLVKVYKQYLAENNR